VIDDFINNYAEIEATYQQSAFNSWKNRPNSYRHTCLHSPAHHTCLCQHQEFYQYSILMIVNIASCDKAFCRLCWYGL